LSSFESPYVFIIRKFYFYWVLIFGRITLSTHTPSLNLKKSTLSLSLLSQLKFTLCHLTAQEKRYSTYRFFSCILGWMVLLKCGGLY